MTTINAFRYTRRAVVTLATWAEHRDQETARLAVELAATKAKLDTAIAEMPWYGRWIMRALYWGCRVWARLRP